MTSTWDWPDWVPVELQKQIEEFYSPAMHRTREDWIKSAQNNNMPAFGQRVRMLSLGGRGKGPIVEGQYVHAWNNIGRLVAEDGRIEYVSNPMPLLIDGEAPRNWQAI